LGLNPPLNWSILRLDIWTFLKSNISKKTRSSYILDHLSHFLVAAGRVTLEYPKNSIHEWFPTEHEDFHGFCRFPTRFYHRDSPAFDVELLIVMCVEVKIPPISSSIPLFWGLIHFCCSFHQYMEGKNHVFAEKKSRKTIN
jgi:hypothetical protein